MSAQVHKANGGEQPITGAPVLRGSFVDEGIFQVDPHFTWGAWEGKPLAWRILELRGNVAYALCDEVVFRRAYHDNYASATWANCELRSYLNQDFVEQAFPAESASCLVACESRNPANRRLGTSGGDPTFDKVLCLNFDEAVYLFQDEDDRQEQGSDDAWWWLRTPGRNRYSTANVAARGFLNPDGLVVSNEFFGVRPAINLSLDTVCIQTDAPIDALVLPWGTGDAAGRGVSLFRRDAGTLKRAMAQIAVDARSISSYTFLLDQCARKGELELVQLLMRECKGFEFLSGALCGAIQEGRTNVARYLLERGASLDGSCRFIELPGDDKVLRAARRNSLDEGKGRFEHALQGPGSKKCIEELVESGVLRGKEFQGVLVAAGQSPLARWMLNPAGQALPDVFVRITQLGIRVQKDPATPVSAAALLQLWSASLIKSVPSSVRVMAPFLDDPNLEGKQEVANLLAERGWSVELSAFAAFPDVLGIEHLDEAIQVAHQAEQLECCAVLLDAKERLQAWDSSTDFFAGPMLEL